MIIEEIYRALDEVGVTCYPVQAPQNYTFPFAVSNIISVTPNNTKSVTGNTQASTLDRYRVQITLFATTYDALNTMASTIRQTLQEYTSETTQCATFENEVDGVKTMSGQDGIYYKHQDFYFWIKNI